MNNPLGPGTPIAQPYGFVHPPGPPPHHHKTSGLAIAALVLGLTGCLALPLLPAMIVGVIALTQTGPGKRPGRGLAIGGLAAAGFWAVGWVALLGNTMDDLRHDTAGPQSAGCATPSPGHADACTLKPGECFEQPKVKGTFDSVELTSCGNAHSTEAIGAFAAADGPWPGAEQLRAEAVVQCLRIMAKNVDRPRLEAAGVYADLSYLAPGRESWEHGVRTVFCTIYSPDAQLTASVLTSGADLAIPTG
ncbi:DUF4190 domain-containing protein [Amycolatopsis regifaucium]|uniref:Septum formation-related domain-containing protein n=1 Tax=Amycolatopsis regifaucium TaxID=546365 RepID=A0A154MTV4_9PSEU|nr:DUF4190 domain-containing protein [Amycolatopsis regifaucium]KZB87705.1 hypothetical protein AVL48_24210 [Amycolatopsis regifaucium]OKA05529.1 hypothetical protein ATP06_0225925 [Amycolatopsis regifaucium]SFI13619.1 Septum formation [Amycolatopsis regifaucium]